MQLLEEIKRHADLLKAETFALYLAAQHPETRWYAKFLYLKAALLAGFGFQYHVNISCPLLGAT
ncbi:MAG: hypothetical protein HY730_03450 [Candidatus Tectomicrobia bacterium]|uniref:Uncharacterized protein n=1 Tax=Tectimicrobiota bacterium TaxID=2528274 RepID=A0A933GKA8_UNCTE|nr:hypothetical protein [Candidatus Tectomicrobia bacterium]